MKTGIIAACAFPAFWIVLSLVVANTDLPVRHEPEKAGWTSVLMMAALVIPTAFVAYQGGKHDKDRHDL